MIEHIAQLPVRGMIREIYRSKGIGDPVVDDLNCTKGLVKLINSAERELVFGIFSLTSDPIAQAILDAHKRGIIIRGIADARQWNGRGSKTTKLHKSKIDIRKASNQHSCMHLKVAVVDSLYCGLGSFNWTGNAEERNDECLLIFESQEAAKILVEQIDEARRLNSAKRKPKKSLDA